jgi:DNA-binding response OmpR family regulator
MTETGSGPLRILLVEDDADLAKPMRRFLERQNFIVSHCTLGAEAISLTAAWLPHLVLLDLSLPDIDGIEVANTIRASSAVPIIMVTARGREKDRITGLDVGADDYLVKPFGTGELLARINAVLRRATGSSPALVPPATPASPQQSHGAFRLDHATSRAYLDGKDLGLTQKEFEILRMLLQRRGAVVRRDELARAVWSAPLHEVAKSLDVHLVWLRRKLGEDSLRPRYLETIRGAGVRIRDDDQRT